jgi:trehalose 6-phosphate phosphatase
VGVSQRLANALPEIAERLARAPRVLLCVGFDGTLAPIADRPDDVQLAHKVRQLLTELVRSERATVAIFSGREREALAALVDVPGAIYVGNHGLEISGPGLMFLEPTAAQFAEPLKQIAAAFESRLNGIPGALVENKGLTIALHFRTVPLELHEQFRKIVHSALADASHPFLLREGRMVYEIRPRAYWNKGHAAAWLREQLGDPGALTVYIGDDNTDEDAFTAIGDGVTIKVGDPAGTAALYEVDGPKDVYEFLHWTLEQLVQPQHS